MAEFRVVVPTSRFDESRRFYGTGLGWRLQRDWPPPGRGAIYEAVGNAVVELLDEPDAPPVVGLFCSVEVDDAMAAADRLTTSGVPLGEAPTRRPWGHLSFDVVDPNGLRIVFFEVLG